MCRQSILCAVSAVFCVLNFYFVCKMRELVLISPRAFGKALLENARSVTVRGSLTYLSFCRSFKSMLCSSPSNLIYSYYETKLSLIVVLRTQDFFYCLPWGLPPACMAIRFE
ncbi:hypothetical protein [Microvirus mar14]|uniref:Uncharacterized protein n=1 Tax=Microvirus mar14 TaxID=2851146 RepID=A0A8F5MLK1_9VIRU|nr:hypothetical protein [Microvirus mar14]